MSPSITHNFNTHHIIHSSCTTLSTILHYTSSSNQGCQSLPQIKSGCLLLQTTFFREDKNSLHIRFCLLRQMSFVRADTRIYFGRDTPKSCLQPTPTTTHNTHTQHTQHIQCATNTAHNTPTHHLMLHQQTKKYLSRTSTQILCDHLVF
jgi:hypothetical protein